MAIQLTLAGITIRPKLRLSEVERLIEQHRIVVPCPSRQTLINWLEDGTLEGVPNSLGWLVYEDSFLAWVRSLEAPVRQPRLTLATAAA